MVGEQKPLSDEAHYHLCRCNPQIAWEAQPDGSCLYFNRRWYDYTGLTRETSLGTAWDMAVHPEDRTPCIERWKRATETGERFETEYRLRGPKANIAGFSAGEFRNATLRV